MNRIKIQEIMTREPIITKPDTNLLDCAKIMVKKKVGSLLLVHSKKLVGIISEWDILWALIKKSKEDLPSIKAIDISPKKLATIRPSATIDDAIKKMKRLKFERLPVIKDGELLGLITAKDIINFNPAAYPEFEEFSEIREETKKLKRIQRAKGSNPTQEGMCEECGNYDILYETDNGMVCEVCKHSM
jgi:CBS domain-containing protein